MRALAPTTTLALTAVLLAACGRNAQTSESAAEQDAARVTTKETATTSESSTGSTTARTTTPEDAKRSAAQTRPASPSGSARSALLEPGLADETAPATYRVKFETTKGPFVMEVHRGWAPNGADRVWNMVKLGYFQDVAFFRAISGFMIQFGIHGDPAVNAQWRQAKIPDDPVKQSNTRGRVTFAKQSAPDTRTVQLFINTVDRNARLDGMGFAPIGEIVDGMDVVDSLYTGYGEGAPRGRGPSQGRIQAEGNAYLKRDFPELDYIRSASIVPPDPA